MKLYPFPKHRGAKLLSALLLLGLILLSRDTLTAMNVIGFLESQIASVLILGILGTVFLFVQRARLKEIFRDPRIALALIAAAALLIPMVIKQDWQLMYVSILFYILAAVFLSYFLSLQEAARSYLLVMTLLAVYSLVCAYGLRQLPDRGILNVPVFTNSMGVEFYNFGLAQVPLTFVKNRNFGIFREPGVYQFFLLLGLFLNNYTANWEKAWKTWIINGILALTMLSTFATGGVIEMGLLAAFLFFDRKWYRQRKARLAAYGLILSAIGAAAYIILTENGLYVDLMGMITKFGSEESGATRVSAIFIDLDIFLHHPFVGAKLSEVLHVVESNSTSTMVLFAGLGILGGLFHVLSWAALLWDRKRSVLGNLILMVILFMSFNTQNLSWNLIFWLFPVIAMVQRMLPSVAARLRKER